MMTAKSSKQLATSSQILCNSLRGSGNMTWIGWSMKCIIDMMKYSRRRSHFIDILSKVVLTNRPCGCQDSVKYFLLLNFEINTNRRQLSRQHFQIKWAKRRIKQMQTYSAEHRHTEDSELKCGFSIVSSCWSKLSPSENHLSSSATNTFFFLPENNLCKSKPVGNSTAILYRAEQAWRVLWKGRGGAEQIPMYTTCTTCANAASSQRYFVLLWWDLGGGINDDKNRSRVCCDSAPRRAPGPFRTNNNTAFLCSCALINTCLTKCMMRLVHYFEIYNAPQQRQHSHTLTFSSGCWWTPPTRFSSVSTAQRGCCTRRPVIVSSEHSSEISRECKNLQDF